MKMYAIKNCDTVKKARNWLENNGVDYEFHDYKKDGVDEAKLREFIAKFGWESVLNMKGMTWRKMSDTEKAAITDEASAIALMLEKPSIIKRPIIDAGSEALIGFKEEEYQQLAG